MGGNGYRPHGMAHYGIVDSVDSCLVSGRMHICQELPRLEAVRKTYRLSMRTSDVKYAMTQLLNRRLQHP